MTDLRKSAGSKPKSKACTNILIKRTYQHYVPK